MSLSIFHFHKGASHPVKPTAQRSVLRTLGVPALALVIAFGATPAFAGTAAGTVISNQASINYTDGNANAYTATSNVVTTTVQNVPALTVVPSAGTSYAPGQQVSDTFTLTNSGNAAGGFTVTSISTPVGATSISYTYNSNSYATLALLQAALPASTAAGSNIVIGVKYNIATSDAPGTNEPTTLTATIAYPAQTGVSAGTSSPVAGTETDNVISDARVDLQKSGVNPPDASTNVFYTIKANDGGASPAKDLTSVKTLLGASAPGILITDAIPQYPAGTPLTVNNIAVATSAVNGYNGGSVKIYTSTAAGSGWTQYTGPGNAPAGTKYIGVFISGGSGGVELTAKPSGSTNGNVTAAAVTITFQAVQSNAVGAGDPNVYLNAANSVIGGNQGPPAAVGQNVIGPGIAANTLDAVAAISTGSQGIVYPTGSSVQAAPSGTTGASNTVGNSSFGQLSVLNGPLGNQGATGSWNGVVANDNNHDFTAKAFDPSGFNQTNLQTVPGQPPIGNALGATALVDVPSTFQNTSNSANDITISVATASGWTAQIFNSDGSGNKGSALTGSSVANPSYKFTAVASNAVVNYIVEYTAPSGAVAFANVDNAVTATVGVTSTTNVTHHDLILGGPIYLIKTATLDPASPGTCVGGTAAVPGCKITYDVYYYNNAPTATACAAPTTSVLSAAGGYFAAAGSAVITEDGAAGTNNWGANTGGLTVIATDTTANTTWTGNSLGSKVFTAKIGGASFILNPGCTGHIEFSVTVN
jgi:hypothetical protein